MHQGNDSSDEERCWALAHQEGSSMTSLQEPITIGEAYAKGMEDGFKRRSQDESAGVRAFASKVTDLISRPGAVTEAPGSTPGTWAGFKRLQQRATEHIVTDLEPSTAATPHGVFGTGTGWALELAQTWMSDAMPSQRYATLIEAPSGMGIPQIPSMATAPTAGAQGGEKTEAYSSAFDIQVNDVATPIDSTLYLNVSGLIVEQGALPIVDALMGAAVAAEANRQIAALIEAAATTAADIDAAFATFDGGRFVPSVVIVPPSQVIGLDAANLVAAGVSVVVDPAATTVLVCAPDATVGWYKPIRVDKADVPAFGTQVGFAWFGRVGVDSAGVAAVAITP
jgi:hypothetical protein